MFCAHCGGSNPDTAAFCQYCGSPLGTTAPLPSLTPPPPPPTAWGTPGPGSPPPPPPRRRSLGRTVLIVLVIFVVIILVAGVVSYLLAPPAANVTITGVNFQSPDNACGLNGAIDPTWYNTTVGSSIVLSYDITGANVTYTIHNATVNGTAACQIATVSTTTSGFSISGANVPLPIAANTTQILSFTVNPPGSGFTGVLTLVIT